MLSNIEYGYAHGFDQISAEICVTGVSPQNTVSVKTRT